MDREKISEEFIKVLISNMNKDPFDNLTVKDVASDLKMGENLANELFKAIGQGSIFYNKARDNWTVLYYEKDIKTGKKKRKSKSQPTK